MHPGDFQWDSGDESFLWASLALLFFFLLNAMEVLIVDSAEHKMQF